MLTITVTIDLNSYSKNRAMQLRVSFILLNKKKKIAKKKTERKLEKNQKEVLSDQD